MWIFNKINSRKIHRYLILRTCLIKNQENIVKKNLKIDQIESQNGIFRKVIPVRKKCFLKLKQYGPDINYKSIFDLILLEALNHIKNVDKEVVAAACLEK